MAYKPKKLNKQKAKKEKDPNKFHFGWNTGTYLIILGAVLGFALIMVVFACTLWDGNSYYRAYNDNLVHPFTDKAGTEDDQKKYAEYEGFTLVESKDFNLFDIDLYCTSFDSKDAHKATFELTILSNENTGNLSGISKYLVPTSSSTSVIQTRLCLAANWIAFESYSSDFTAYTKSNITETTKTYKTVNVSLGEVTFPTASKTWPVPISINYPDAYLFICFKNSNKANPDKYLVHFTENDFIVKQATETKKITSPAH